MSKNDITKQLEWNAFYEDFNGHTIKPYNVLNKGIVSEIIDRTKKLTTFEEFEDEVKRILMYHFWSRSEWEIVLCDWPTHIDSKELARLNIEQNSYFEKYGSYPIKYTVDLSVSHKVDIWDQVCLNWKHFINYVWKELKPKNA